MPSVKLLDKSWKNKYQKVLVGNSLVVQQLGLRASTAGGMGSILGQGFKISHTKGMAKKKNK